MNAKLIMLAALTLTTSQAIPETFRVSIEHPDPDSLPNGPLILTGTFTFDIAEEFGRYEPVSITGDLQRAEFFTDGIDNQLFFSFYAGARVCGVPVPSLEGWATATEAWSALKEVWVGNGTLVPVDGTTPPIASVPEGGTTALLFGLALAPLALLKCRKFGTKA